MYVSGALDMSRAALYFANAAKRVTMQPIVNEVQDDRAMIKRLQSEIDRLRSQLARLSPPLYTTIHGNIA